VIVVWLLILSSVYCEICMNGGKYDTKIKKCVCLNGWGGNLCSLCNTDSVCGIIDGKNGTCIENSKLVDLNRLTAECNMVGSNEEDEGKRDVIGRFLEFHTFNNTGEDISINGWDNYVGKEMILRTQCVAKMCKIDVNNETMNGVKVDRVKCAEIGCKCVKSSSGDRCDKFTERLIGGINGGVKISCVADGFNHKECNVKFSKVGWHIPLHCDSSRCGVKKGPQNSGPNKILLWFSKTVGRWVLVFIFKSLIMMIVCIIWISRCLCNDCAHREFLKDKKNIFEKTHVSYNIKELTGKVSKYSISNILKFDTTQVIVSGITFQINPQKDKGKLHLIVGKSGRGKSTILKKISEIGKGIKFEGDIHINDEKVKSVANYSAASYPTDKLYSGLTIIELLTLYSKLGGNSDIVANNIVREVMDVCSINDISERIYNENDPKLSGGQCRRCKLAMALVQDTKILFLDEPLNGSDSESSMNIVKYLAKLVKKGVLVVIIEHNTSDSILSYVDEITAMDNDNVLITGSKEKIRSILAKDSDKNTVNLKNLLAKFIQDKSKDLRICNAQDDYETVGTSGNDFVLINEDDEEDDVQTQLIDKCKKDTTRPRGIDSDDETDNSEVDICHDPLITGHNCFKTSILTQLWLLTGLMCKYYKRRYKIVILSIFIYGLFGAVIGGVAYNLPNDLHGSESRMGAFAMITIAITTLNLLDGWTLNEDRDIVRHDVDSKLYYPSVYIMVKTTTHFLFMKVIQVTTMVTIFYALMGTPHDNLLHLMYKYFILNMTCLMSSYISMCIVMLVTVLIEDFHNSWLVSTVITIITNQFNNLLFHKIGDSQIVKYLFRLMYTNYAMQVILSNEFDGVKTIVELDGFGGSASFVTTGGFYLKHLGIDPNWIEVNFLALFGFSLVVNFVLSNVFKIKNLKK